MTLMALIDFFQNSLSVLAFPKTIKKQSYLDSNVSQQIRQKNET